MTSGNTWPRRTAPTAVAAAALMAVATPAQATASTATSTTASTTTPVTRAVPVGHTIIADIGNSATDLSGGHAEQTYKLPDYGGQLS